MTTSPALRINRPGWLNPLGPSAPFCLSACKFGIVIAHFPTLLFLRDTPVIVLEREIKTPKPVPAGTLGATFYVIKIWAQASCVLPLKRLVCSCLPGQTGAAEWPETKSDSAACISCLPKGEASKK